MRYPVARRKLRDVDLEEIARPAPPPRVWEINKTMLWRLEDDGQKRKTEIVRHDGKPTPIADEDKNWFVKVTVDFPGSHYKPPVSHYIGEVQIIDGTNPTDALKRLVDQARARADFLNLNGVKPETGDRD